MLLGACLPVLLTWYHFLNHVFNHSLEIQSACAEEKNPPKTLLT